MNQRIHPAKNCYGNETRQRLKNLEDWIVEQYEEHCLDYDQEDVDFRVLYRHCCEIIGSTLTELNDLTEDDDLWSDDQESESDGQPDDLQENEYFAQDGYFENQECDEEWFWS